MKSDKINFINIKNVCFLKGIAKERKSKVQTEGNFLQIQQWVSIQHM